jgi:hypothetical protein
VPVSKQYNKAAAFYSFGVNQVLAKLSLADTAPGQYRFFLFDVLKLQISVMSFYTSLQDIEQQSVQGLQTQGNNCIVA